MAHPFIEYEGSVLAQSNKGNYYELKKWNIKPNGEIEAIDKRKLTVKEVKYILKQLDPE
ncbi:MAG: hypothetical protein ACXAD7_28455 [Candidatus Kariarchaeaceae archaeon]|jgi:hypothetical protein